MKDGSDLFVLFNGMAAVHVDIDSTPAQPLSTLAVAGTVLTVRGTPEEVAAQLLKEAR